VLGRDEVVTQGGCAILGVRQDARERLAAFIATGLVAPKKRIATKPSYGSKLRRLDDKRGRAEIKRGRSTKGVME